MVCASSKSIDSTVPISIIILTGYGSIDLAVTAVKIGAEQFLTKPFELSALAVVLERALENQRNRQKQLAGNTRQLREALDAFAGESDAVRQLADQATRVASADCPVLITGETGAGKGYSHAGCTSTDRGPQKHLWTSTVLALIALLFHVSGGLYLLSWRGSPGIAEERLCDYNVITEALET